MAVGAVPQARSDRNSQTVWIFPHWLDLIPTSISPWLHSAHAKYITRQHAESVWATSEDDALLLDVRRHYSQSCNASLQTGSAGKESVSASIVFVRDPARLVTVQELRYPITRPGKGRRCPSTNVLSHGQAHCKSAGSMAMQHSC
jgi:hypothetical protein